MKYKEFMEKMLRFADEIEDLCEFRDSFDAEEVEVTSEDEQTCKDEVLLATSMFNIEAVATAIGYYNKPEIIKGYLKLVDRDVMLQTATEQIKLYSNEWIEYAVPDNYMSEYCFDADKIGYYNPCLVREIADMEGLQVQIRR